LHFRRRAITNQELKTLHNEISHIRADIEDIKEQIAEFIIKTN
jgi:DNA-binding winged helix-turn-helix (wHTH) protein